MKTRVQKAIVLALVVCLFASITLTVGAAVSESFGSAVQTVTDTPTDVFGFFRELLDKIIAFFQEIFGGAIC